jgi:hypothetical protein
VADRQNLPEHETLTRRARATITSPKIEIYRIEVASSEIHKPTLLCHTIFEQRYSKYGCLKNS